MSIPAAMFAADLAAAVSDIPQTVTVGGVTKRAVVGSAAKSRDAMSAGGMLPIADLEAHIFLVDWATVPAIGNPLTHGGSTYRIVRTESDPSGVALRLFCESVTA